VYVATRPALPGWLRRSPLGLTGLGLGRPGFGFLSPLLPASRARGVRLLALLLVSRSPLGPHRRRRSPTLLRGRLRRLGPSTRLRLRPRLPPTASSASSGSVLAAGASPMTASLKAGSCGSISTSTAPSDAQRLSIRSRRTSPSDRDSSDRRTTSGSVHAPPTQPFSSPSAVTNARSPTRADDGRSTPTTVARTNGSPPSASRPASTSTFTPPGPPCSALPTRCPG
jgi:hypothetical protein